MPFHITVLPASTQAGKATIKALLNAEEAPIVRGIYRDPSKAPSEFSENPRFETSRGNVAAVGELNFSDSDAVLYVPPPTFNGERTEDFANAASDAVLRALQSAPSVKKLVVHSALAAQNEEGIVGPSSSPSTSSAAIETDNDWNAHRAYCDSTI
jgi:hypothetical protein